MADFLQDRRRTLALLGGGLAAPGFAFAQAPGLLVPEAEFSPDETGANLEAMEDHLRRMTAPVMINDHGPFDFVVDTGANRSVMSRELAAQLGLPQGPDVRLHGITGERSVSTALIDRFRLGERQALRVNVPLLPGASLGGHGLLGVDGLKKQRVLLDFERSRLLIELSGRGKTPAGALVHARRRFGQLTVVDTDLDGIQVSLLLDTGCEVTLGNLALRRAVGARRPRTEATPPLVQIRGATGEVTTGEVGMVPVFRLGSLTVRNLRLVYADLHPFKLWNLETRPAMLMGMDLMRFFSQVSLDFARNEVRFLLPDQPFIDPAGDPRKG